MPTADEVLGVKKTADAILGIGTKSADEILGTSGNTKVTTRANNDAKSIPGTIAHTAKGRVDKMREEDKDLGYIKEVDSRREIGASRSRDAIASLKEKPEKLTDYIPAVSAIKTSMKALGAIGGEFTKAVAPVPAAVSLVTREGLKGLKVPYAEEAGEVAAELAEMKIPIGAGQQAAKRVPKGIPKRIPESTLKSTVGPSIDDVEWNAPAQPEAVTRKIEPLGPVEPVAQKTTTRLPLMLEKQIENLERNRAAALKSKAPTAKAAIAEYDARIEALRAESGTEVPAPHRAKAIEDIRPLDEGASVVNDSTIEVSNPITTKVGKTSYRSELEIRRNYPVGPKLHVIGYAPNGRPLARAPLWSVIQEEFGAEGQTLRSTVKSGMSRSDAVECAKAEMSRTPAPKEEIAELASLKERVKRGGAPPDPPVEPGAVEPTTDAMYTGGSLESLGVKESELKRGLKKHLGTREEYLGSRIGPERGTKAYNQELEHQARQGLGEVEADVTLSKKLTKPATFEKLSKIPYVGERGAAKISRGLRALPKIGSKFGVGKSEMPTMFDAAEGIKGLDDRGNPIFGTMKRITEGGKEVGQEVRFTPEQGKANYEALTPQAKEAVRWVVGEQDHIRQTFNVAGEVEGYMKHIHPRGFMERFTGAKLKHKTAGGRKFRTEALGHERNFEKAARVSLTEFANEQEFNRFIDDFAQTISEKVGPEGLKEGYREIPKAGLSRGTKYVGQLAGGRQVPEELYKDFVAYVEKAKEIGQTGQLLKTASHYFKANLLALNPGSAATNFIGGGIQFAAKITDDVWRGILTGNPKPVIEDIKWIGKALSPSGIKNIPPELFGAKSNIRSQWGESKTGVDVAADAGLAHYGAIENYWKRAIAGAELSTKGTKLDPQSILADKEAFATMNKAVDTYAFNYHNVPQKLAQLRESPVGGMVAPFITYPYKATRFAGRYIAALNPGVTMTKTERTVRLATLGSIIALNAVLRSDDPEKNRMSVGGDKSLRTTKYPLINWKDAVTDRQGFIDEMWGEGPLVESVMAAKGWSNKYDRYKTGAARAGEQAKAWVPGFRITESLKDIAAADRGEGRVKPQTFENALAPGVPGMDTSETRTGEALDPDLERLKFYLGLNVKRH